MKFCQSAATETILNDIRTDVCRSRSMINQTAESQSLILTSITNEVKRFLYGYGIL
jgi:hypothetical protein